MSQYNWLCGHFAILPDLIITLHTAGSMLFSENTLNKTQFCCEVQVLWQDLHLFLELMQGLRITKNPQLMILILNIFDESH